MAIRFFSQNVAAARRIPAAAGWEVPMEGVTIVQVPALKDNYVYLLQSDSGQVRKNLCILYPWN